MGVLKETNPSSLGSRAFYWPCDCSLQKGSGTKNAENGKGKGSQVSESLEKEDLIGPLLKMTLRPYRSHFACTWHELGKDDPLRTSWKKHGPQSLRHIATTLPAVFLGWIKLMSHGKTTTLQCIWLIALSITSSVECFKKGIIPRMDDEGNLWHVQSSNCLAKSWSPMVTRKVDLNVNPTQKWGQMIP